MNIVAIIQARLGSTRFPEKVFANLAGRPLIWHVTDRLKYSKTIKHIVLATTDNTKDDKLAQWAIDNSIDVFRGSEDNVLERFYYAAKKQSADIIVRITADDPFKDPNIIDKVVTMLIDNDLDFAYNNNPPSFPEGLDTEVFTVKALEKAYIESKDVFEQEHVTQFFYRNKDMFNQLNLFNKQDLSYLRWTVDTELDYQMSKKIYDLLYCENKIFLMEDIMNLLKSNPEISLININVSRSTMYKNN